MERAARTPDLANFAKMTDRQKLADLATLHDATDYSGMTEGETIAAISKRHSGGTMADRASILQEINGLRSTSPFLS